MKWQKVAIAALVVGTLTYIKVAYFPGEKVTPPEEIQQTEPTNVVDAEKKSDENALKSYVNVYFIGQNENKEEIYKVVKRPYDAQKDGTKIKASIKYLLEGPTKEERTSGVYSELPKGVKLLAVKETPEKIIVDLSSNFEQGGGTDGLYKRIYQLIKTAKKNTTTNVYLYINGKQADVVGGEGIMINQPLSDRSLDE